MIKNFKIEIDLSRAPNADRMQAQADDVIGAGLVEMGLVTERQVKIHTPVGATGLTRGGIFSEPRGGNPIREVVVGGTQPQTPFVESGRDAGKFPPPGPIALWVRRVLHPTSDRQLAGLVFVISRKIAQEGTHPGAQMFKEGLKDAEPTLQALAQKIGADIVVDWNKATA